MNSLTSKMVLALSLVLAALLCLFSAVSHVFWRSELQKSIGDNQQAMVEGIASQLDTQLHTALNQLVALSRRISDKDLKDVRILDHNFAAEEDALVFFNAGLELLTADGKIITEFPLDLKDTGRDVSYLEHYKKAAVELQPFIGSTYRNHNNQIPTIPFVVPLLTPQGTLRAVMVGRHEVLKSNTFSSLALTRIGQNGYFYIIDTERRIVFHSDPARIMANLHSGSNAAFEAALDGYTGIMENVNSKGVPGLTSFRRLKSTNWFLAIHHPVSEAYQPLYRSLKISVVLVILALLLNIAVTRSALARMLAPLNRLTELIQGFIPGQGKTSLQQLVSSDDEVGRLGLAYDRMVAKIDEQHFALLSSSLFAENLVMYSATPSFVIDSNHRILFWNLALAKLTGLTSEEMQGTDLHWKAFYAEKRPTMADLVLDHAEQNVPHFYENFRKSGLIDGAIQSEGWYSFPDLGKRFLYFHAAPIKDGDGNVVAVVENLEDLTETKKIEDMLNEQYRFLQQVLDSIPNPVFYKNHLGAYIGCNRAFEVFFDRNRMEIMGKNVTDLNLGETAGFNAEQDKLCISTGNTLTYETTLVRCDGESRQVISTKAPMSDRNGIVNGLVGTFTDITERKQTEIALRESEEKFRSISDSAQDGIIMIDNDGLVTFWNTAAEKIFGYAEDEILGRNLHDHITPVSMRDTHRQAFAVFRETGLGAALGTTLELPAICKDGSEIPVEFSLSAVLLGGKWCAIGLVRDITVRKEAQEAIAASQAALEAKHTELGLVFSWVEAAKREWEQTLDSLKDIIIMTDAAHHIRRCNHKLLEITGMTYDSLAQQDWREVLAESGFTLEAFDGKSGELHNSESRHQFKLNIYELHDPDNTTVSGLVVSMNDVTEIKEMTRELAEAYSELQSTQSRVVQQEKMASIGQMAAGVAHEINNPVGFITSNLNTMNKYMNRIREYHHAMGDHLAQCGNDADNMLEEMRRRLKIDHILEDAGNLVAESLEGTERVRKIVQDLKSFSRVDETDEKMADINQCLESTINIAWNEIKYIATLTKNFGDIAPIRCFPQQLNQVFMNLLVNAAHAISGHGEITVSTWSDADSLFVAVSDNGCGISAEVQMRIFEPFFTTKEAGKGTGLGLSISNDIVRRHGGDITVESTPGLGTKFTVRLPLTTCEV